MEDKPYSKREEDAWRVQVGNQLDRIEKQTEKTNGSVARAFVEISKIQMWKNYISGGLAVITLLLVPILLIMIGNYLSAPHTVAASVVTK